MYDYLSRRMIVSSDGVFAAQRGALIHFNPDTGATRTVVRPMSAMTRLVNGTEGNFAMLHQEFAEPAVRKITAHSTDDPAAVIAAVSIADDLVVTGSGDATVWTSLPPLFDLVFPYVLDLSASSARILRIPGIPDGPEDPDDPYRLVTAPGVVIVSRSRAGGRFVVFDAADGSTLADLELGFGPPTYRFSGADLWVAHTDTIFRIDTTAWSLIDAIRLRGSPGESTISTMEFDAAGTTCAVAFASRVPVPLLQPYRLAPVAGTMLMVDTDSFEVTATAPTRRWADEIAVLGDGRVVTRERSAEQQFAVVTPSAATFRLYPPRPHGEEWH